MAKKSLLLTYTLWLFFGFTGLHHFYLNRDRHAFVMWMSVGGYFGCGWIRDLWNIPRYVADANDDTNYLAKLADKMRKKAKPDSGIVRHMATIIIADILGYLVIGAIPTELFAHTDDNPNYIYISLCAILAPLAVAIGVHTVGNIGRQKGSIKWALIGAYLTAPLYTFSNNIIFWTSLSSNYFFNKYSKEWRRIPLRKKSFLKRVFLLTLCGLIYSSLWTSWVYFNCSITDKNDQEVKCRDAVQNFFKSPMWQECSKVFDDLKLYISVHGWSGLWREIVEAFDPQGEANALKTLDLPPKSSQEEITAKYRKLSRQWHPDKHREPSDKKIAEEKFIEIQRAYEVLSRIKSQRIKAQQKPVNEEEKSDAE